MGILTHRQIASSLSCIGLTSSDCSAKGSRTMDDDKKLLAC